MIESVDCKTPCVCVFSWTKRKRTLIWRTWTTLTSTRWLTCPSEVSMHPVLPGIQMSQPAALPYTLAGGLPVVNACRRVSSMVHFCIFSSGSGAALTVNPFFSLLMSSLSSSLSLFCASEWRCNILLVKCRTFLEHGHLLGNLCKTLHLMHRMCHLKLFSRCHDNCKQQESDHHFVSENGMEWIQTVS